LGSGLELWRVLWHSPVCFITYSSGTSLAMTLHNKEIASGLLNSFSMFNIFPAPRNDGALPVPSAGFFQATAQGVFGVITQYGTTFLDRGLGMGYITGSRRAVLELHFLNGRVIFGQTFFEDFCQII